MSSFTTVDAAPRQRTGSLRGNGTIGIRREDKNMSVVIHSADHYYEK